MRLKAAIATWLSAVAESLNQAMLKTGGVEMEGPEIVTLPLDTGAESAASISPRASPVVGDRLVPVAYSTSGQSLGNLAKAAVASLVKLARRCEGIFSNAIMPLSELKGPAAEAKNEVRAAGWVISWAWMGRSIL